MATDACVSLGQSQSLGRVWAQNRRRQYAVGVVRRWFGVGQDDFLRSVFFDPGWRGGSSGVPWKLSGRGMRPGRASTGRAASSGRGCAGAHLAKVNRMPTRGRSDDQQLRHDRGSATRTSPGRNARLLEQVDCPAIRAFSVANTCIVVRGWRVGEATRGGAEQLSRRQFTPHVAPA